MSFRLPDDGHRAFLCGMTGSGKTRGAVWQLSMRSFDKKPWVIVDFKYDSLIAQIEHIEELRLDKAPPKKPGLYIIHPRPDETEQLQQWLWQVWKQENIGLLIDEGYMIAGGQGKRSPAFDAILTQGRSKRIPCITLTQRPVWLPPFVISESDFFQVFHLNSKGDRDKIREFVPAIVDLDLPRFYSHWYDVANRFHTVLKPVPSDEWMLERFHDRLKPKRRVL